MAAEEEEEKEDYQSVKERHEMSILAGNLDFARVNRGVQEIYTKDEGLSEFSRHFRVS